MKTRRVVSVVRSRRRIRICSGRVYDTDDALSSSSSRSAVSDTPLSLKLTMIALWRPALLGGSDWIPLFPECPDCDKANCCCCWSPWSSAWCSRFHGVVSGFAENRLASQRLSLSLFAVIPPLLQPDPADSEGLFGCQLSSWTLATINSIMTTPPSGICLRDKIHACINDMELISK